MKDRSILRLLKLIGCDNAQIGTYAKLVDDRNDMAHPNGNIFFSTQAALDTKVRETIRAVDEIQSYSRPVIEHCYQEFLLQNRDPEEREFPDAADQIREVLIHANYLSLHGRNPDRLLPLICSLTRRINQFKRIQPIPPFWAMEPHNIECRTCRCELEEGMNVLEIQVGIIGRLGFVALDEKLLFCNFECLRNYLDGSKGHVLKRRIP